MTANVKKVLYARAGGRVERAHTIPHHGSYSNSSHQWGVAILMWYIFPRDYWKLSLVCLTHDIAEFWVGDITSIAKDKGVDQLEYEKLEKLGLPTLQELTPEEQAKVKACDYLELLLWCIQEMNMGNNYALDCYQNIKTMIETADWFPLEAKEFFKAVLKEDVLPSQKCLAI